MSHRMNEEKRTIFWVSRLNPLSPLSCDVETFVSGFFPFLLFYLYFLKLFGVSQLNGRQLKKFPMMTTLSTANNQFVNLSSFSTFFRISINHHFLLRVCFRAALKFDGIKIQLKLEWITNSWCCVVGFQSNFNTSTRQEWNLRRSFVLPSDD